MDNNAVEERQFNQARWHAVSHILVTLMLTCGALTLVSFLNQLEPAWVLTHLVLIAFLVALDRLFVHRQFRRMSVFSSRWSAAFAAQWVVIAVISRVLIVLFAEPAAIPFQQLFNIEAFFLFFFTADFLFALFIAMIVWLLAGQFADLLDELSDKEAIIRLGLNYSKGESRTPRQRLVSLIFIVGGALVLLTAYSRLDLRTLVARSLNIVIKDIPPFVGAGGSTMLYFLLALVLLSLSQFLDLYTVWSLQRVPVNREVVNRWPLYSLVFLGVITLVVSLLPTSYGLGYLGLVNFFLSIILFIIVSFAQLILLLLFLLMALVVKLFHLEMPMSMPSVIPRPQPLLYEPERTFLLPPGWEVARSTLFWIFFGLVLVFAVMQYLRLHEEVFRALRKVPGWNVLMWFRKYIGDFFGGIKNGISKVVEAGRERLRRRREQLAAGGYMSLRRLDARQRVRFFYLALIRRGTETGLTRSPAQTPQEYAAALDRVLPEVEQDIDALTDEFIKARYTRAEVAAEEASQVKSWWERIKKVLQERNRK